MPGDGERDEHGASGGETAPRPARGGARATAARLARSRAVRGGVVALVVAGLLAWWLVPSRDTPYPRGTVSFATGSAGGVYERYGKMLRPRIERDLPGVRVRLVPTAGSVENVRRVAEGEIDFTIATADAVAKYDDAGHERLRGCAQLYDDYVQLVVPRDSKVRSAKDLRGRRVAIGQADSGVELLAKRLLLAAGLDPARDVDPVRLGIGAAPEELEHRRIDAFFWSGGLPTKAITELTHARGFPVRLVPLGDLVEPLREQTGDTSEARSYYRQALIPSDAYPEAHPRGEAVSTIAVPNLLVTTDRADPGLMERLTRTVINSRDKIGESVHAAQVVDLRTAIYTDPLRLHDGAARYYRSVKP